MDYKKFIQDRDSALLSLDKSKILDYCKKYGMDMNFSSEKVFWAAVHKARLNIDIPQAEKEKSREWLKDNGFKEDV